ncbi:Uncharacterised protein [Mycobacteroides abscessus]|nr:Uncharacterised protein [Mycobacteroides abscessus]
MPLPPPPADGLTSSGNPTAPAAARRSSSDMPGSPAPGTTGTPRAPTMLFAASLSAIASSASTPGPTNAIPARSHARASAGFSERKP